MKNLRVLAFYLPQYHPIPENNEWWGKGFTEWTNVAKAKPLFRGHYQPKIPTELGFYDLRMPEIREEQARLATEAGIEGFAYWHYWFGNGRQLLERPFKEVLESGSPDFPFCLAWANHSWSNSTWKKEFSRKQGRSVIMEQLYPGLDDDTKHFYSVLPAFKDKRYITVDGCPVFLIFNPEEPAIKAFIKTWRSLARKEGLKGIHFVAFGRMGGVRKSINPKQTIDNLLEMGYDAVCTASQTKAELECNKMRKLFHAIIQKVLGLKMVEKYKQKDINSHLYIPEDKLENVYPMLIPNWDRTPRVGRGCTIYTNSTPEVFENQVRKVIDLVANKQEEHRIAFLKSWNEWGEGNYVEPDLKYGRGYLDVLRKALIGK